MNNTQPKNNAMSDHSPYANLKKVGWFLIFLGLLASAFAFWGVLKNEWVRRHGAPVQVGVTRIWQETSNDFNFHSNGRNHTSSNVQVEVVLLEPTPKTAALAPVSNSSEPVITPQNINNVGAAHTAQALKRIDDLVAKIKTATTAVAIPANAPRFKLQQLPAHIINQLYTGQMLNAKRWGDSIYLEKQYEERLPESAQVLLLSGLVLLVMAGLLLRYCSIKNRAYQNAD